MSRYKPIALPGAVVVITGGARGIGEATARLFAEKGASVWIGDVDEQVAKETAASIPRAQSAGLDVTSVESWVEFLKQVREKSGPVDVLVNNAGVMPMGGFTEESERSTDLMIDVNLRGPLNGSRAVLPEMLGRRSGHIINVASMAGKAPLPGLVTYCATKFGVVGLSLGLRGEYADSGVSVTCVLPGAVRTELSSGAAMGGGMPTVDPEDIATAIVQSVRSRRAQISVPGWMVWGAPLFEYVPEPVERLGRRLFNDRRALESLDLEARKAYTDRLDRQSAKEQR